MKKLVLLLFCGLASLAFSQNFLEDQMDLSKKIDHQISISVGGQFNKKIGWWAWSLTNQNYSSAYVGPSLFITNWLQVGSAYGIETATRSCGRYGSFIMISKGQFSLAGFYETGVSGYWHRQIISYKLTNAVSVGVMDERSNIRYTGLRTEITIKKIRIWNFFAEDKNWLGIQFLF